MQYCVPVPSCSSPVTLTLHSPVISSGTLNFASSSITSYITLKTFTETQCCCSPSSFPPSIDMIAVLPVPTAPIFMKLKMLISRLARLAAAAVLVVVARPGRYSGAGHHNPHHHQPALHLLTHSLLLLSKLSKV